MADFVFPLSGIRKEASIRGWTKTSPKVRDVVARLSKRIWGPRLERLGMSGSTGPAEFIEALDNQRISRRNGDALFSILMPTRARDKYLAVDPGILTGRGRSAKYLGVSDRDRKRLMRGYEVLNKQGVPLRSDLELVNPATKRTSKANAAYEAILRRPIGRGAAGEADKALRYSDLLNVE